MGYVDFYSVTFSASEFALFEGCFCFSEFGLIYVWLVYYELMCEHMKYSVYIYNSVHIIN